MASSASRTIKSAHRVLEILEYFDRDRQFATVMEMSRALNYPQSSTSELLRCLTRLGYLHYNRVRRTYSPTARVALLGAWVKPPLFRGGPVLSAIDDLARESGETVILSTSNNYALQHLHVIHGEDPEAIDARAGEALPVLHSAQGRLLLSSYRNEEIRSAVHRLNAEEPDLSRHVRTADVLAEFAVMRERGWIIEDDCNGIGCVAVLLPRSRGSDRLTISIVAKAGIVAERGQAMLEMLLRSRDQIAAAQPDRQADDIGGGSSNVVPMHDGVKIPSYHRRFA